MNPFADFMLWSSKVFSLINPVLYNAERLVLREYSIYTQTFQVVGNNRFSFLEMESRAGHWNLRLLGPQADCPVIQGTGTASDLQGWLLTGQPNDGSREGCPQSKTGTLSLVSSQALTDLTGKCEESI